jgi:hypothetical protein
VVWSCQKGDDDGVKRCAELEVDGKRLRDRPKRTWEDVARDDMKRMNLSPNDVHDWANWRRPTPWCNSANQGSGCKHNLFVCVKLLLNRLS